MKRILAAFLTLALLLSLAACAKKAPEGSLTGTVSAVKGSKITVAAQDGKSYSFTVNDATTYTMRMPQSFGEGGERPEGFDGERPEMPEGFDGQMPEDFDGKRPDLPDGERPEMPEGFDGQMPKNFDGEMPEMPEGDFDPNGENPMSSFNMQPDLSMITEGTMLTATINADGYASDVALSFGFGSFGARSPGDVPNS